MSQPTPEQIKKEIETLTEMKPKVKRFSAFGHDHYAAIDAQVDVLKNDLSTEDIDGQYEGDVQSQAHDARAWLEGEYALDTLSEDWEGLAQE